jgi:hypothetical protein
MSYSCPFLMVSSLQQRQIATSRPFNPSFHFVNLLSPLRPLLLSPAVACGIIIVILSFLTLRVTDHYLCNKGCDILFAYFTEGPIAPSPLVLSARIVVLVGTDTLDASAFLGTLLRVTDLFALEVALPDEVSQVRIQGGCLRGGVGTHLNVCFACDVQCLEVA